MPVLLKLAIILLLIPVHNLYDKNLITEDPIEGSEAIYNSISTRQPLGEAVIIPDANPFYGIIGAYLACWYDTDKDLSGLLPLFIQHQGKLTDRQRYFLNECLQTKDKTLLVIGESINTTYSTNKIMGSPPEVAIAAASQVFTQASTVLIFPYKNDDAYRLSLLASPLASYLNSPILIYDNNSYEIQAICQSLNVANALLIGEIELSLENIQITRLESEEEIQNVILTVIKERFGGINYITLTNPVDIIPQNISCFQETRFTDHIDNVKVILLGKEIDVRGCDVKQYSISIPTGINRIQIYGDIKDTLDLSFNNSSFLDPIIFMSLADTHGNIVAYASSLGLDIGKTYLETLTCNASGNYTLSINVYHGVKGGFFIQRGLSIANIDFEVIINVSTLKKPHLPFIPNLSMISPYLTAAHGGIIVADPGFELTGDTYCQAANESGTGPWYNEQLHIYNNERVNYTIDKLQYTLSLVRNHDLLNDYYNGPAWLAILADTNMIPMYYYTPSQKGLHEKGLPSDNPYSLDWNLSVGRLVGYNVTDVLLLITRTLFYQNICKEPISSEDWHNRFSFIFGEGFGETGGLFHQIPYAREIREYGFITKVYGILKNSRKITTLLNTYTGSNYIEYLGHADWYWFPPSLYSLDYYSSAVDVAHAKYWNYSKPSIFLTSACLMARIDGIPPNMNIGITMLHAGCNCFIGATRETGREAGLTILENHLIIDNLSVGESLRGEKRVDKELPTYYVRVLYGDPAFNPYEPNNGFSNQGRPVVI